MLVIKRIKQNNIFNSTKGICIKNREKVFNFPNNVVAKFNRESIIMNRIQLWIEWIVTYLLFSCNSMSRNIVFLLQDHWASAYKGLFTKQLILHCIRVLSHLILWNVYETRQSLLWVASQQLETVFLSRFLSFSSLLMLKKNCVLCY